MLSSRLPVESRGPNLLHVRAPHPRPQDINEVSLSLLLRQPCVKVLVGDPYQVRGAPRTNDCDLPLGSKGK
jgi:hypothetical protein